MVTAARDIGDVIERLRTASDAELQRLEELLEFLGKDSRKADPIGHAFLAYASLRQTALAVLSHAPGDIELLADETAELALWKIVFEPRLDRNFNPHGLVRSIAAGKRSNEGNTTSRRQELARSNANAIEPAAHDSVQVRADLQRLWDIAVRVIDNPHDLNMYLFRDMKGAEWQQVYDANPALKPGTIRQRVGRARKRVLSAALKAGITLPVLHTLLPGLCGDAIPAPTRASSAAPDVLLVRSNVALGLLALAALGRVAWCLTPPNPAPIGTHAPVSSVAPPRPEVELGASPGVTEILRVNALGATKSATLRDWKSDSVMGLRLDGANVHGPTGSHYRDYTSGTWPYRTENTEYWCAFAQPGASMTQRHRCYWGKNRCRESSAHMSTVALDGTSMPGACLPVELAREVPEVSFACSCDNDTGEPICEVTVQGKAVVVQGTAYPPKGESWVQHEGTAYMADGADVQYETEGGNEVVLPWGTYRFPLKYQIARMTQPRFRETGDVDGVAHLIVLGPDGEKLGTYDSLFSCSW